MLSNKVNLNDDVSEALLCGSKTANCKLQLTSVQVGGAEIPFICFGTPLLSVSKHISATVKTCLYYLRLLSKLRPYIRNKRTANTVAVSFVSSFKVGSLVSLWGLPDSLSQPLNPAPQGRIT